MKRVTAVMIPLALLVLLAGCGGGNGDGSGGTSGGGTSGGGTSGGGTSGGGSSGGGSSGGGSSGGGTTVPPAATAPSIVTQPVAQSVTTPAAATFSIAASGTDPLSYQWRSSINGTDWTNISGATAATYDSGATDSGMNGRYYSVVVSNSAGNVASASVQLTVTSPPSGDGGGGSAGGDGGGSGSGGSTPPSDGSLHPLTGTADPFPHVIATLSATPASGSRQNQSIISWDPRASGFNLGLTHLSGAETRLFLPGGVFRDEVFLRFTEITDIGPQVTTVLAAVRIEPGDLLAEKTITATFTIPDAVMATVDVSQMIGFAADSDGSNLHLMPIVPGTLGTAAARPGIKLGHLGIVGIALATPAQQAALAAAWPSDTDDQLDAAMAPGVTANWRSSVQPMATTASTGRIRILAADAPGESPLLAPLRGYFNDVVVPAFAAAYGDPVQIPAAIQTGYTFLRDAELSGLAGTDGPLAAIAADLNGRISTLIDTYADYVAEQCRTLGGPPQLQLMLGTIRGLQLAGHTEKSAELEGILPQCSRFKATFTHDFTRNGHWVDAGVTIDESIHTIIKGTTTFGVTEATVISPMRLVTATLDRSESLPDGSTAHSSWEPEDDTSPWGMFNIGFPVIRTRSGTASTSVEMSLHAFNDIPLQVTLTRTSSTRPTVVTPDVIVSVPLSVPALPKIDGTVYNYGPMVIPQSGSATSEATRTIPYAGGGSATEHEKVTVTMEKAAN